MKLSTPSLVLLLLLSVSIPLLGSGMPNRVFAQPPSGVLYYVPITLNNTQSTATPANFQQQLYINFSAFSSYVNSACSNLRFFSSTWVPLNAWLENASSTCNTDTEDVVWVNMSTFTIAAQSTATIYMGIYSTSTNNFNSAGPWGEAPELSSTYGQYDDGAKVFTWYENFAGTSLPSDVTVFDDGVSLYTVNNGITLSAQAYGEGTGIYKTSGLSSPFILETLQESKAGQGSTAYPVLAQQNSAPTSQGYAAIWTSLSSSYDFRMDAAVAYDDIGGSPSSIGSISSISLPYVATIAWLATGTEYVGLNYTYSPTIGNSALSLPSIVYPVLYDYGNTGSSSLTAYWLRTRTPPPNFVMPTVSFGTLTQHTPPPTIIDAVNIQLLTDGASTPISGSNCFTVYYYDNSSTQSSTNVCDGNIHTINANDSSTVTILATSTGSTSSESWQFTLPASNVTFSASNSTFIYYYFDLLSQNIAFGLVGGGAPPYPNVTYTSAPATTSNATDTPQQYNLTLSASYQTIWPERSTTYFANPNPIMNGTTERWMAPVYSWLTPQSGNVLATYYHQYMYNLTFNVSGPSGWGPPVLTGTQNGTSYAPTLTTSYAPYWLDNSTAWSVSNPLPGSTQSNYWKDTTDTTSGTVSGTLTQNFTYQWGYSIAYALTTGPFASQFCLTTTSAGPYNITFENLTAINVVYSNDTNFWFYGFPSSSNVRVFTEPQEVPISAFVLTGNQSWAPPASLQPGSGICMWVPTTASSNSTSLGFGALSQIAPRIIAPFGAILGGNQYFFSLIYTLITVALYLRIRSAGFIAVWLLVTSPVMGMFIAPELRLLYVVSMGLSIGLLIYTVVKRTEYT